MRNKTVAGRAVQVASTCVAFLMLAACGRVAAQTVNKCVVDGRTVYQAQPCEAGGRTLRLEAAPDPAEVAQAQARAAQLKSAADQADAVNRNRQDEAAARAPRPKPATGGGNCAALTQQYEAAWAKRHAFLRNGRKGQLDPNGPPDRTLEDIGRVQQQISAAGCPVS